MKTLNKNTNIEENPNQNDIDRTLLYIDFLLKSHDYCGAYIELMSLDNIYKDNFTDVQCSFYFYLLSLYYELKGDVDNMLHNAEKALKYAQTNEQKTQSYNVLACGCLKKLENNNQNKDLIDKANSYLDNSIKYAKECHNECLQIEPIRLKAWIARCQKDYDFAIEELNNAAELANKLHNHAELAFLTCQIADILSLIGKKNLALSEFYRAENYAKLGGDYNFYCRIVLHRLALMFELEESNPSLREKAKADIINIASQQI